MDSPLIPLIIEWSLKIFFIFGGLMTALAYLTWFERRVLAYIQMRLGPNRVGPAGLLQPLADGIKFIFKEDIVPLDADKFLYTLAPIMSLVPALTCYVLLPFGDKFVMPGLNREIPLHITHVNVGVLAIFALTGMGVYGIVLAGYASNNKYSLMGGLRSSAQMVSYELAMVMSIIGVLLQAGSLDLVEICKHQAGWFGMQWHLFTYPPTGIIGFFIFLIAMVAETNRVPFDLPEAETELVAGFHTEYSSMKFAMFFIAEYANMVTASAMATILFLGGWMGPFVDQFPLLGPVYFTAKVGFFLFLYVWLRGTLPRYRYDQLMNLGWKFLLPLSLVNLVLTATIALFFM
ncbi:MAG: NADH-quinone oxidoreductase subunit NuoH [Blastocatellia bacterium]|nr:NADH-quinone oxidoreductase subunit NuoH [Blastocatellia bacterium]